MTFLELSDLVNTKPERREQLVFPTTTADIYIDIISGNLEDEINNLKKTMDLLKKKGALLKDNFEFLANLEAAFGLAKTAFETNTMNQQIMEELHEKSMKLLVDAKEGKVNTRDLTDFTKTLSNMKDAQKKAKKFGLQPVILEKTGEKWGRASVYRVK